MGIEVNKYIVEVESPIGTLRLIGNRMQGLMRVLFPEEASPLNITTGEDDIFSEAKYWLSQYFQGNYIDMKCHIFLNGTEFQKEVWHYTTKIPYGRYQTYGDIAKYIEKKTGKRMSPQAVGQALGKNPLPIFIPCHRVLGQGGKLTGYSGGIERKIKLLSLEKIEWK